MRQTLILVSSLLLFAAVLAGGCVHQPMPPAKKEYGNYPEAVGAIIVNKCAISGCHNAASYENAKGLRLDKWEYLFDGSANGAVVIPFSAQYSPLLYFVNTDPGRGVTATPVMPVSTTTFPQQPLTADEYSILKTWIDQGAPDDKGNVPFAANPDTRQKIYLTQQGCDLLAVIDAEKQVVMRYIPVGTNDASIESPHCVRVSADGMYAYVSYTNGTYIQKIDTRTDQIVGAASIGFGAWNILHLSDEGNDLLASDWQGTGSLAMVKTADMVKDNARSVSRTSDLVFPHGITSNRTFDTFFIALEVGNSIYKLSFNGVFRKISLNGKPAITSRPSGGASPDPHEVLMAPGYDKYFVTCQGTNEVRVMDARTDRVLDSINVGTSPKEMALSTSQPYLFVTCQEDDANPLPGHKGSVYVINYNTHQVVKTLYGDFYQPHGIAVDDRNGMVYIASTNANPNGIAPHHATACDGRAGWYTIYNLATLAPENTKRYQVTVDPYSAAVRFK